MTGLALYRAVTGLLEPFAPAILRGRARRGKEDDVRVGERLGRTTLKRPDGPLVWLHGVSVGESVSLLPLIDRIRAEKPHLKILVTSGTVTSAQLLAKRLPPGVLHQYAPVDGPRAVARFLDHWRPDVGLFAESELWPNLLLAAKARGVTLGLVSARITDHSAKGWAKRPQAAHTLLGAFNLILPQDAASADRLVTLGAKVGPQLNLKDVGGPLPVDGNECMALEAIIGSRDVVVAASTHEGEEAIVSGAVPPGPLLIIVPRHPERGEFVAAKLRGSGRRVARRSMGEPLQADTDIYLADTLGELGLFYSLADISIVGGSLLPGIGGHNPLEPARAGTTIISGPHVFNFEDVYEEMRAAKAVWIANADLLDADVAGFLSNPDGAYEYAMAARDYAGRKNAAFATGWALIRDLLP